MADKKVKQVTKMVIAAGKAQAGPPVGSTLGPTGINLMQFCKEFNDQTSGMIGVVPVVISIYEDRTFSFILKTAPVAELIKQTIGIKKGAADPLRTRVGKITKAQIQEIAEKKMVDLNAFDVQAAMRMVEGTCRSMGIKIED